jgi:hypothetical protein
LQSLAQDGLVDVDGWQEPVTNSLNVHEASKRARRKTQHDCKASGWRVHFPRGASSFFFNPFTRDQFDRKIQACYDVFYTNPPYIKQVGSLFGWNLHRAPLARGLDGEPPVTHARFTTRINLSLNAANNILLSFGLSSMPLIATPPSWNRNQQDTVYSEVLQAFEKDAYVVLCNVPGPVSFRFVYLLRRFTRTLADGRRSTTYVMVVADTEANALSRAAEGPEQHVEWVQEGGTFLSVTEAGHKTVDMSYDHWTSCQNDQHAQELFLHWAQFVSRWSQIFTPANLLASAV